LFALEVFRPGEFGFVLLIDHGIVASYARVALAGLAPLLTEEKAF